MGNDEPDTLTAVSNAIRTHDGDHTKGAGEIAEIAIAADRQALAEQGFVIMKLSDVRNLEHGASPWLMSEIAE